MKEKNSVQLVPSYIFNADTFRKNHDRLLSALKKYYGNVRLAYSMKTNYAKPVCNEALLAGAYLEAVSPHEHRLAISYGAHFDSIIFNGVCKTVTSMMYAASSGSIINLDNLSELKDFLDRWTPEKKMRSIGLRVTFDIENGIKSHFGFAGCDFYEALSLVKQRKNIRVTGLHCHFSHARDLASWKKRAETMITLATQNIPKENLKYIDLGGNLFSPMPDCMKNHFGNVPSFEDYGKVIGTVFKDAFPDENVELILEPGTALVADAVSLCAKVLRIKEYGEKKAAILNVSKYDLGAVQSIGNVPFTVYGKSEQPTSTYDLFGYTCMEDDILAENYTGSLAEGDIIVFKNAGAYSFSTNNDFICPAIGMNVLKGGSLYEAFREATVEEISNKF